jgi:hypothetical protein
MEPTAVERGCMGGIINIIITGGPRRRGMRCRLCRPCRLLRGDDRVCVTCVVPGKKPQASAEEDEMKGISCPSTGKTSSETTKLQLGEHSGPIHIHTYRVDYELGSPRGLRVRTLHNEPISGPQLALSDLSVQHRSETPARLTRQWKYYPYTYISC